MTASSGSDCEDEVIASVGLSSCAPGNALTEPDKCQHQNEERDGEQAHQLPAVACPLTLLQLKLAFLGTKRTRAILLVMHRTILLVALFDFAFGRVVVEVEAQRNVGPVEFGGQWSEGVRSRDAAPGGAIKGNIA